MRRADEVQIEFKRPPRSPASVMLIIKTENKPGNERILWLSGRPSPVSRLICSAARFKLLLPACSA